MGSQLGLSAPDTVEVRLARRLKTIAGAFQVLEESDASGQLIDIANGMLGRACVDPRNVMPHSLELRRYAGERDRRTKLHQAATRLVRLVDEGRALLQTAEFGRLQAICRRFMQEAG